MEYLYNFYSSPSTQAATQKLGFAALPQFVANIIVQQLVDHAMCDNGEYALSRHRQIPSPLIGTTALARTIDEYLSAYTTVDPLAIWGFMSSDDSGR